MNKVLLNKIVVGLLTVNLVLASIGAFLIPIGSLLLTPVSMTLQSTEMLIEQNGTVPSITVTPVAQSHQVTKEEYTFVTSSLATIAVLFILSLGYLLLSFQLYKFFLTIKAGNPFDSKNGSRLRKIGGLLISGGLVLFFYNNVVLLVLHGASAGLQPMYSDLMFVFIVLGLMVLVVAEAFIQGHMLEEEQDSLV